MPRGLHARSSLCHKGQFLTYDGRITLGPAEPSAGFLGDRNICPDAFDEKFAFTFGNVASMFSISRPVGVAGSMPSEIDRT